MNGESLNKEKLWEQHSLHRVNKYDPEEYNAYSRECFLKLQNHVISTVIRALRGTHEVKIVKPSDK